MREIKFRAWVNEGEMTIIHFGIPELIGSQQLADLLREPHELMQYTGLKDKNGKEIYEGDILKNTKTGEVFECFYNSEMASFEGIDRTQEKIGGVTFGPTLFPLDGKIEVIGNLYENPELLK